MFMKEGGILGFHCAYQYPQRAEGTDYYERYPLTLKGADAVLFTVFRALGLTVHIKAHERHCYGSTTKRLQGLISTRANVGGESEPEDVGPNAVLVTAQRISDFERSYYVGDEIFWSVAWFNEWAAKGAGKEYHEVAQPVTRWIGNETEIEWEYAFLALLIVVPEFSKRELKD
jgi:hypothetical protein